MMPKEIADMFCLPRRSLNRWLETDRFPAHVGLHLSNYESFLSKRPIPIIHHG